MDGPRYVEHHWTRSGMAVALFFGVVVPVGLGVAMTVLTRPNDWWFWGFALLAFALLCTCGELVPEATRLRESRAWGAVKVRLDEEGVYFGDEDKFISWSRVITARLVERRGDSSDSEPPPTWFELLVEAEPDDTGREVWGCEHVGFPLARQVISRYAPGKAEICRLPA